ncbi:hypothetical protein ACFSKI_19060 [Pseudogracilibacillus auburnensis]|uniref:Uncharacterized protein n=1 Tax=Pseudogracilibacillus auburnensis TaxID=1494959 RepID=A0A2V3W518_9BACI|nr:hypothetical protein [Pseudogracilibacillus auburnensis]PXW88796.1 hypothetical protein DFR56_103302 [Pseudogracilibacillus auburnensis]
MINKNEKLTADEFEKLLDKAPDSCLITGLKKCNSYGFDNQVVYLSEPAYDAYTLPWYVESERCFYRARFDMDDDFRKEYEFVCSLEDLEKHFHPNLKRIKEYYGIN